MLCDVGSIFSHVDNELSALGVLSGEFRACSQRHSRNSQFTGVYVGQPAPTNAPTTALKRAAGFVTGPGGAWVQKHKNTKKDGGGGTQIQHTTRKFALGVTFLPTKAS